MLKKKTVTTRVSEYKSKEMQSEVFRGQEGEPSLWLQCNLNPKKTAVIINVQEQMIETKAWKVLRGISSEGPMCRLCGSYQETVHHIVAGYKMLAGREYPQRYNNTQVVLAMEWAKQEELIHQQTVWYKEKWEQGKVLENKKKA